MSPMTLRQSLDPPTLIGSQPLESAISPCSASRWPAACLPSRRLVPGTDLSLSVSVSQENRYGRARQKSARSVLFQSTHRQGPDLSEANSTSQLRRRSCSCCLARKGCNHRL